MVTEKGNETTTQEDVSTETTPKVETPTAEEQLKTLQAKVEELTKDRERLDSGYKGLQRTIGQKDAELKKQANIDSRIDTINERIELLATAYASGKATEEDMGNVPKEDRTKVLDQLKQMRQKEIAEKQQNEMGKKGLEYKEKVEAAGLTEKDEAYWEIEGLVRNGQFQLADIKINKLEASKVTKPEVKSGLEKKETDEEIFTRIAKQKGLLKTDNVTPAGGTKQWKQIRDAYVANPNDMKVREEYLKARRERGL